MSIDLILYILAVMIFWDFSLHVIELFGWVEKFTQSKSLLSYYYPHFYWKKTSNGPAVRDDWQKNYQRFWVAFWATALLLILAYLIFK